MKTKNVKHIKYFSFKGTTTSTFAPNNPINRESKEDSSISSENFLEDMKEKSQINISADISSIDQSFGHKSSISEEIFQKNTAYQNQFKSDNESNKKGKNPIMTNLNTINKCSEIQKSTQNIGNSLNYNYKTDSDIQDKSSFRVPFFNEKPKDRSIFFQIFNLSGDLFGVWIYMVPTAFYYGGIYLSLATFCIVSLMIYYSEMLLVSCAVLSKKSSFKEIAVLAYGDFFGVITKVWVSLYKWCEIVISLIFLNKLMAYFLGLMVNESEDSSVWLEIDGKLWTPCFFFLIIIPLSLFRKKIWFLSKANILSFIIAFYTMILVIYEAFARETYFSQQCKAAKGFDSTGFLSIFPIACFSFCKGGLILTHYQRVKNPNIKKIGKELIPSRIINLSMTLVFGVFGYITWSLNPNELIDYQILILSPYPKNLAWVLAYICIIIGVLLMISESVRSLEMDLWAKNRFFTKILSIALLALAVVFSIFVFEIKEIMIWCGCLISSPVYYCKKHLILFIF